MLKNTLYITISGLQKVTSPQKSYKFSLKSFICFQFYLFGEKWSLLGVHGHFKFWTDFSVAHRIVVKVQRKKEINSQSLEDTQVGYILQKYTLDNYTLEKYTLAQKSLVMVATSLVMMQPL